MATTATTDPTAPPSYDETVGSTMARATTNPSTSPSNPVAPESDPLGRAHTAQSQPQRRVQRRTAPLEQLPTYTRSRADDPNYISALEQWARTKMYVVPGQDGTFNMHALGARGVAGGQRPGEAPGYRAVESQAAGDGDGDDATGQRRESRFGRMLRRLSTR